MHDSTLSGLTGASAGEHVRGSESMRQAHRLAPDIAMPTLGFALLLGIAGDSLLWLGPIGPGFPILVGLAALALVALSWRAELPLTGETKAWLIIAVTCASAVVWRDAELLQVLNGCGALGALVLAAASTNRAGSVLFAPRLRDTLLAFARAGLGILAGFLPLALREAPSAASSALFRGRFARSARAVIIAAVLLLVFGALLRSADPIFASVVAWPAFDFNPMPHLFLIAALTMLGGGWGRTALLAKDVTTRTSPVELFQLNSLEITAALGTLNVLFAAFVFVQLGWLFGGENFLQARTGLTAAEYARGGFFQMVLVVTLVVPVLVATRAALVPGRDLARRHTLLAVPIVLLLGAIIASAAMRLNLYVRYYGMSVDRLYPLVFMAWLAFVLVWLTITVLRENGPRRLFTAGTAISALATLASLNVIAPDRIVARINIDRAKAEAKPLDLDYLAGLSGEATPLAVRAVLTTSPRSDQTQHGIADYDRCGAARHLLAKWGPTSNTRAARQEQAAWRSWNAGEAKGLQAVANHSAELRDVMHTACRRVAAPTAATTPQR